MLLAPGVAVLIW